jgi:hypothetical protein
MSTFKSREMVGAQLETVPEPYDLELTKSIVTGRLILRTRSARKVNAPVRTPIKMGGGEGAEKS